MGTQEAKDAAFRSAMKKEEATNMRIAAENESKAAADMKAAERAKMNAEAYSK